MSLTQAQKTNLRAALVADANGYYTTLVPPGLALVPNSQTIKNPNGTLADMDGIAAALNIVRSGVFFVSENQIFGREIWGAMDLTEMDAMSVGQAAGLSAMTVAFENARLNISVGTTLRASLIAFFAQTPTFDASRVAITAMLQRDGSEFENVVGANTIATRGDVASLWKDG